MTSPDDDDRYEPMLRMPVTGQQPQVTPRAQDTNGSTPTPPSGEPRVPGPTAGHRATFDWPPKGSESGEWPSMEPGPRAAEPVPTPAPIPIRNAQPGRKNTVRIGLWGSPRSGKTTVLAALPIAAMQGASNTRNWIVSGVGDLATSVLTDGVHRLVNLRSFPAATTKGEEPILWSFQGQDGGIGSATPSRWSRIVSPRTPRLIDFALELQDVTGEYYRNTGVNQQVVQNLAESSGLLYLFDPVLDSQDDLRSFNYFFAALQQVTSRVRDLGRMDRGRLPHHVAVLITKFDDPAFFEAAVRADWVNQDQTHARMPYVPAEQGSAFFDWVCRARQGGTAVMVRDALRNFFHHDRIEYFASSAIGFRLNPHGVFDYHDYHNVEIVEGVPRIRSLVRPVNVLEPLVRMERRISRGAR